MESFSATSPNANRPRLTTTKRPRPVRSCDYCRRKKLKCDRLSPCGQCEKSGRSSECLYSGSDKGASASHPRGDAGSEHAGRIISRGGQAGESHGSPGIPVPAQDSPSMQVFGSLSADDIRDTVETLQSKVALLEQQLTNPAPDPFSNGQNFPELLHRDGGADSDQNESSPSLTKGTLATKFGKSRYHESDQKLALILRFPEALGFIHNMYLNPQLAPIKRIKDKLRKDRLNEHVSSYTSIGQLGEMHITTRLLHALPSRDTCVSLEALYFCHLERLMRVLHIPTFIKECWNFWEVNGDGHLYNFTDVVPQLLVIIGIGLDLKGHQQTIESIAGKVLTANNIYSLVETWVSELGVQRRNQIPILRTKCLLLIARTIKPDPLASEDAWGASAALVRYAFTMGLHRDPSEFPGLQLLERESRRRLWATIMELDIQTSLIGGHNTMIREGDYTCLSPSNITDEDLVSGIEDGDETLLSKPMDEWTNSLCQVMLFKSLPLRLEAIDLASKAKATVRQRARSNELCILLEKFLADLPEVLLFNIATNDYIENPSQLLSLIFLDVFIRRAITFSSRRQVLALSLSEDQATRAAFIDARNISVKACMALLSHKDCLQWIVSDLEEDSTITYLTLHYNLCKMDIFQAAFLLCVELQINNTPLSEQVLYPPGTPTTPSYTPARTIPSDGRRESNASHSHSKHSLLRAVNNTVDYLIQRTKAIYRDSSASVRLLEMEVRDPMTLTVIAQSVRDLPQDRKFILMKKAALRVMNLIFEIDLDLESEENSLRNASYLQNRLHLPDRMDLDQDSSARPFQKEGQTPLSSIPAGDLRYRLDQLSGDNGQVATQMGLENIVSPTASNERNGCPRPEHQYAQAQSSFAVDGYIHNPFDRADL